MKYQIRNERPGDENDIDIVNCRAFGKMNEAYLVRGMRDYYPAYDRRYSITAWDGDRMVGHTLFTPTRTRLMNQTILALAVGPVGVVLECQRRGIGGQMLNFGHDLGRREGFQFAFLLGHHTYYPRYGYQPCFGFGRITIDREKLPEPTTGLHPWPVRPADIPWLVERHAVELADIDFGCLWGTSLGEWTVPNADAQVWWTEDGRRAGYSLRTTRDKLHLLLADDPLLARDLIATLRPEEIFQHPSGWLARNAVDPAWGKAEVNPSRAAMVCQLREGVLRPYLEAVEAGRRPVGSANWQLPFVLC
jgi:putative acetyltransferase